MSHITVIFRGKKFMMVSKSHQEICLGNQFHSAAKRENFFSVLRERDGKWASSKERNFHRERERENFVIQ